MAKVAKVAKVVRVNTARAVIKGAIIEAHHGKMAVTRDGLGQGTTVRFDLPFINPASVAQRIA
jgi:hypothetical protein